MTGLNRRHFLKNSAALASVLAAPTLFVPAARAKGESYLTTTAATPPFTPIKVLETSAMPWSPPINELGWKAKTLYNNEETGDHLVIIWVPIGAPGGRNHYHDFHEWAYWLTGDFVNNEYTSPLQRIGDFQQFREGVFLDRPAYSLHGGEPGRLDSQVGGTCLIMEEGGKTIYVIPDDPNYSDEWKQVKQWTVPRIIDTISELPWEPYDGANDIGIKRLVNDQVRGFRAVMWLLPAGWKADNAGQFGRAHYYKQAHQFNYILNGDLQLQCWASPDKKAEQIRLAKDFYFEKAPMSISGLADGAASETGCVWLQVTYAKGTSIPNVPIEDAVYI